MYNNITSHIAGCLSFNNMVKKHSTPQICGSIIIYKNHKSFMGNEQDVMLRSVIVEKVLLKHDPIAYGLVIEHLTKKYGLDMCECYWNSDCLIETIQTVCKNSYTQILHEIKTELAKYGRGFPYERLVIVK